VNVTVLDSFENAVVSKDSLEKLGVNVLEMNIQNRQSLEQLDDEFDAIIHLAAQVSVPKSIQDPLLNHAVNVDGTDMSSNSPNETMWNDSFLHRLLLYTGIVK
jgi:nucleoside-diphosphate-sugar epimerase